MLAACSQGLQRRVARLPVPAPETPEHRSAVDYNARLLRTPMDSSVLEQLATGETGAEARLRKFLYWSQAYPDLTYLQAACLLEVGDLYRESNPGLANDYYQMISQDPRAELSAYRALAIAGLTALAGRQASEPGNPHLEAATIADAVFVRANPDASARVIGTLNRGRALTVMEISSAPVVIAGEAAYWYRIASVSGLQGWIFGRLLEFHRRMAIDAKGGWTDTGAVLLPNQHVRIDQQGGLWSVNSDRYPSVDASGYVQEERLPLWNERERKALRGVPFGALIAAVGDRSTPFYIGRHGDFTPPRSGRLELRINEKDEFLADNSGAVTVFITIQNESGTQGT